MLKVDKLDCPVKDKLKTNMREEDAVSSTCNLFVKGYPLLSKRNESWVIEDNLNLAVWHVSLAFRLKALRKCIQSDLWFGYKHLKHGFKAFMQHCLKLLRAVYILHNSPNKTNQSDGDGSKKKHTGSTSASAFTANREKNRTCALSENPLCLYEPQNSRSIRHLLKDCKECLEQDKIYLMSISPIDRTTDHWRTPAQSRAASAVLPSKRNKAILTAISHCGPHRRISISPCHRKFRLRHRRRDYLAKDRRTRRHQWNWQNVAH